MLLIQLDFCHSKNQIGKKMTVPSSKFMI